jgi:hypothetical protein
MSIHICINYVLFCCVLLYAANKEFVFHVVDKVNPNLVTCDYVVMCGLVTVG